MSIPVASKVWLLSLVSLPLMVSGTASASADVGMDNKPTFFHALDVILTNDLEDDYDRSRVRVGWSGLFKLGDIYLGPMLHGRVGYYNDDKSDLNEYVAVNATVGGEVYYAATEQPFIPSIAAGYYHTAGDVSYAEGLTDRDYSYDRDIFTIGLRQDIGRHFSAGLRKSRWSVGYDNSFTDRDYDYTYLNASFYPSNHWAVSLQKTSGDADATIVGGKFKLNTFAVKMDYYSYKGGDNAISLGLQWNFGGRRDSSIQQVDRISFLLDNGSL